MAMVDRLEGLIDEVSSRFEPPTEFVVPGENEVSARLDVARTVCRRAERAAVAVAAPGSAVVPYLNRLSDLLFVMGRAANDMGRSDVLWEPGKTRGSESPVTHLTWVVAAK